jgi:type IV pilus assembly protein PilE
MNKKVKQAGFTLIELMIVVGIVGILVAIAYPAYQDQIRKTKRADAEAGLTELAQFMERFYTSNGRYVDGGGAPPALPFTQTPKDENAKAYNLSLSAVNATSFTLQAVPIGAQAADSCGTLTLTNTGQKGASGGAVSTCW